MTPAQLKEVEEAVDEVIKDAGYGSVEIIIKDEFAMDLILHKRKRIKAN